jgi:hypothetical protein
MAFCDLITGEILALANPVSNPPETNVLIALPTIVSVLAVPAAPMFRPVLAPCPEIVEMVLLDTEEVLQIH